METTQLLDFFLDPTHPPTACTCGVYAIPEGAITEPETSVSSPRIACISPLFPHPTGPIIHVSFPAGAWKFSLLKVKQITLINKYL
jgi:hypothetical protein